MRFKIHMIAGLSAALLAGSAVQAHHSFSMFDQNKMVTWEGTVRDYQWRNPHTHVIVEVPASAKDPSLAGTWDIEAASVAILSRQGWNKSSFHPGDKITIVGHPLRSGDKGGSLFYAIDKTGRKLYHDTDRTGRLSGADVK